MLPRFAKSAPCFPVAPLICVWSAPPQFAGGKKHKHINFFETGNLPHQRDLKSVASRCRPGSWAVIVEAGPPAWPVSIGNRRGYRGNPVKITMYTCSDFFAKIFGVTFHR
ncbi:MAG: hypothetical protein EBV23_10030 [Flavobacteriia bacterium]|nr:hypothetical protein [Flavobacteriia bacterium]